MLDLVSWVRIAVLMNVYLGLGNSGGSGFWNEGYMSQGREMDGLVYEQPEDKVDGSCHSKEGSKLVRGGKWGKKRTEEGIKQGGKVSCTYNLCPYM